ncbi:MAG: class I SAM-dependent methyltransferase [Alphaproteobacteria bacterium]
MAGTPPEFALQQSYYARTAGQYDDWHASDEGEHDLALAMLIGWARHAGVRSILDVGSGTGRALRRIKAELPGIRVLGIEPSEDLRRIGHAQHDLTETELVAGDALALAQADGAFDLVCAFGALHHIRDASRAIDEMLRVADRAIFLSDNNNYGMGSPRARLAKRWLWRLGLWPAVVWLKTRGKGWHYSEGDGIYYSYSLFSDIDCIRRACRAVHVMNTDGDGAIAIHDAGHVAVLGLKR